MAEYANELALAWCVLLNILVFGAAYRFAIRRMTIERGQAVLDAGLIGYAIQYASVGLPGLIGALRPNSITAMAVLFSALLWVAGSGPVRVLATLEGGRRRRWAALAAAFFSISFVIAFVFDQRFLPVMSNDGMTYHFPAAVQWLQSGRIDLFQVWFFNPANTYSPLAGSTFIAWLMAPFGNDLLARFVQVPALLFAGIAIFQLCRRLGVEIATAALIAGAAVLSRPFLFASIMGKDDLFVVAFFLCALLGMSREQAAGRFGPVRIGIALGLLLATKYSAFISAVPLVLLIDGPPAGWRWRQWLLAASLAFGLAGPWYLRNLLQTGNPVFPVNASFFRGLFSLARSEGLRSAADVWNVLTGGNYGLPVGLMAVVVAAWVAALLLNGRRIRRDQLLRASLLGPLVGLLLFISSSPFPEVRFVLPSFALLFAAVALGIQSLVRPPAARPLVALVFLGGSAWSAWVSGLWEAKVDLSINAFLATVVLIGIVWFLHRAKRWVVVAGISVISIVVVGVFYVNWAAYVNTCRSTRSLHACGWDLQYPQYTPLWQYCQDQLPADSVIAYANTYLVYPLQGFSLDRHVVYAPTRAGIQSQADLPWLGDKLSGEQLVAAATAATLDKSDGATWLANLRRISASYLFLGKGPIAPPEAQFVLKYPNVFRKLIETDGGTIYSIDLPD